MTIIITWRLAYMIKVYDNLFLRDYLYYYTLFRHFMYILIYTYLTVDAKINF
jgi:hypothetical protein